MQTNNNHEIKRLTSLLKQQFNKPKTLQYNILAKENESDLKRVTKMLLLLEQRSALLKKTEILTKELDKSESDMFDNVAKYMYANFLFTIPNEYVQMLYRIRNIMHGNSHRK